MTRLCPHPHPDTLTHLTKTRSCPHHSSTTTTTTTLTSQRPATTRPPFHHHHHDDDDVPSPSPSSLLSCPPHLHVPLTLTSSPAVSLAHLRPHAPSACPFPALPSPMRLSSSSHSPHHCPLPSPTKTNTNALYMSNRDYLALPSLFFLKPLPFVSSRSHSFSYVSDRDHLALALPLFCFNYCHLSPTVRLRRRIQTLIMRSHSSSYASNRNCFALTLPRLIEVTRLYPSCPGMSKHEHPSHSSKPRLRPSRAEAEPKPKCRARLEFSVAKAPRSRAMHNTTGDTSNAVIFPLDEVDRIFCCTSKSEFQMVIVPPSPPLTMCLESLETETTDPYILLRPSALDS